MGRREGEGKEGGVSNIFPQALIVADAYKQCLPTDWVSPLYKKVILGGDIKYLAEYKSVFSLTPTIIQELASKYDTATQIDALTCSLSLLSLLPFSLLQISTGQEQAIRKQCQYEEGAQSVH